MKGIKPIVKIILMFISMVLLLFLGAISFIYSIFALAFKTNLRGWYERMSQYALRVAIVNDIMGNVICKELLDDTLIRANGYKFGTIETVSKSLGHNKKKESLSWLGRQIVALLNWIDPNHVEKAVESPLVIENTEVIEKRCIISPEKKRPRPVEEIKKHNYYPIEWYRDMGDKLEVSIGKTGFYKVNKAIIYLEKGDKYLLYKGEFIEEIYKTTDPLVFQRYDGSFLDADPEAMLMPPPSPEGVVSVQKEVSDGDS